MALGVAMAVPRGHWRYGGLWSHLLQLNPRPHGGTSDNDRVTASTHDYRTDAPDASHCVVHDRSRAVATVANDAYLGHAAPTTTTSAAAATVQPELQHGDVTAKLLQLFLLARHLSPRHRHL
jgi:hypothetical protein